MGKRDRALTTEDGITLYGVSWESDRGKKLDNGRSGTVFVLVHGMAEHIGRYHHFASFLADKGIAVYGFDLRGHGKTGEASGAFGFLAEEDGWRKTVDDIDLWIEAAKADHPDCHVILFGHSMGSLLARAYASRYGEKLAGLILSGTSGDAGLAGSAALLIAKISSVVNGPLAESFILDRMVFDSYARSVKNRRTRFDWLSRDDQVVDEYIADPLCGKIFSSSFFIDLIRGCAEVHKPVNVRKTPLSLPVYIFSGSRDPVGGFSRGVSQVYKEYRKAGLQNISLKLYSEGRHEMLNETNRDEVYRDVLAWILSRVPSSPGDEKASPPPPAGPA